MDKFGKLSLTFLICLYFCEIPGRTLGQSLLDPLPRSCRSLGNEDDTNIATDSVKRNEYPAGSTLLSLARVTKGVKGVFEFYLCMEEGNTEEEECLIRVPLELADGSGSKFDLSKVVKSGTFEIPIRIPEDVTCDACTLQMRVLKEECLEDDCQLTEDEFCADISIREIKEEDKRIFDFLFSAVKTLIG